MSVGLLNSYRFQVANGSYDPDAQNYIDRVQAADGQALEAGVVNAIFQLFEGMKEVRSWRGNDITVWEKMGYTLPFCAPRTIEGAMIPLQNLPASTAFSTSNMNWDRETGLRVTATSVAVYVDIPYLNNADPQNDCSMQLRLSQMPSALGHWLNCRGYGGSNTRRAIQRVGGDGESINLNGGNPVTVASSSATVGWRGYTRNGQNSYLCRVPGSEFSRSDGSAAPTAHRFNLFRRADGQSPAGNGIRCNFLQLGRDIDLAAVEAMFDTFRVAVAAAI
jgi:hypothetical protein